MPGSWLGRRENKIRRHDLCTFSTFLETGTGDHLGGYVNCLFIRSQRLSHLKLGWWTTITWNVYCEIKSEKDSTGPGKWGWVAVLSSTTKAFPFVGKYKTRTGRLVFRLAGFALGATSLVEHLFFDSTGHSARQVALDAIWCPRWASCFSHLPVTVLPGSSVVQVKQLR